MLVCPCFSFILLVIYYTACTRNGNYMFSYSCIFSITEHQLVTDKLLFIHILHLSGEVHITCKLQPLNLFIGNTQRTYYQILFQVLRMASLLKNLPFIIQLLALFTKCMKHLQKVLCVLLHSQSAQHINFQAFSLILLLSKKFFIQNYGALSTCQYILK